MAPPCQRSLGDDDGGDDDNEYLSVLFEKIFQHFNNFEYTICTE
jgi:hypothetical protein